MAKEKIDGAVIVKFETGEYAIRKKNGNSFEYKDLHGDYWWSIKEEDYIMGNKKAVEKVYERLKRGEVCDYGTVIEDEKEEEY